MTYLTVSGKTIEEAVAKAATKLNTTEQRIAYKVVQEPKKGFFGFIGSQSAVIEARLLPDPVEEAQSFLQETVKLMIGITPQIVEQRQENSVLLDIQSSEKLGTIIGRRGQTLKSLEYLTNLVANKEQESYIRFELDAENYRERRKKTLERLAIHIAEKVLKTNRPVSLEPMNALERKIIHTAVQTIDGVTTVSEGSGVNRHIIVKPESEKIE